MASLPACGHGHLRSDHALRARVRAGQPGRACRCDPAQQVRATALVLTVRLCPDRLALHCVANHDRRQCKRRQEPPGQRHAGRPDSRVVAAEQFIPECLYCRADDSVWRAHVQQARADRLREHEPGREHAHGAVPIERKVGLSVFQSPRTLKSSADVEGRLKQRKWDLEGI